jgi:defect-in-organelle-trafficking protein DotA
LSELFGNIPHVLAGDGSGMMGHLFYALNQGILVVAGVWLVYTIFNILLRSGLEGTLHGPTVKTAYALFRIAVGLCLVLPSSTTGYSAIQDVMMKVVVEGVNLADETWSYALNYMQNGGMLYTTPSDANSTIKNSYKAYLVGSNNNPSIVATILKDEVSMYASNVYNQQHAKNPALKAAAAQPYQMILVPPKVTVDKSTGVVKLNEGEILFPGAGNNNPPYSAANGSNNSGQVDAYPGYSVQLGSLTAGATGSSSDIANYQHSYQALVQMAQDLRPLAKNLVNGIMGSDPMPTAEVSAQTIATSVLDYLQLMTPYARYNVSQAKSSQKAFIDDAKAEGWLGAGNFYWDLANLNDSLNASLNLSKYVPTVSDSSGSISGQAAKMVSSVVSQAKSQLKDSLSQVENILKHGAQNGFGSNHAAKKLSGNTPVTSPDMKNSGANKANSILNKFSQQHPGFWKKLGLNKSAITTVSNAESKQATSVNASFDTGGVDFDCIIQDALRSVVDQVSSIETSSSNSAFYDPLMFVQQVGKSCLSAAGSIWAQSISWMIGFAAISGICASMMPGANITQVMSSWLTPLWQASAGALFAAGFMMTFYTPLYPYLLFTFGVIGWVISVIEAMVAAPLVAFGMTHPEGHDFLGRAEQALMLALGVFLRPVLMVIGYLSAIILSYIGFAIVNFSFGQVLVSSFTASSGSASSTDLGMNALPAIWTVVNGSPSSSQGSHFTGHDLSDFLLIPLLMIGYGLILIEVVNQCFSLVHVLPDMVLRWIGGPVQQDMSERYASQVQSGLSGSAKQGGQVAGQGATGFGGAMGGMVVQPAVEHVANSGLTASADSLSSGGSGGSAGAEGGEGGADALALMA